ncbi:DUF4276 family protein [Hyalangium versicolor]|uniref:DUF4276 family protein n=1 Tax=Hyalangium versicolor TaxID=2861190 RepID=UPI001CCF87E2|nr:DUF4276 family protein [Hyalangium versicolor]
MSVRIYVEGGGNTSALKSECRRGFSQYFAKFIPPGKQPRIIACGSRDEALDDFRTALRQHPGEHIVLLVDAEAPVAPGQTVWEHLKQRDGWEPPTGATDDNAHLMVQCMESWFLADPETLADYFGQGFQPSALPRNPNIEDIAKLTVFRALEAATRQTKTKGAYSKGGHSFAILARIDPNKVRRASPHAERLAVTLLRFSS